ncbi:MAG: tRNA pseudouridine(13) synthase TruD [Candidatus Diapherotrites archaeon]|nr:tRNA pseudouridine(13) synthase TruD [Candidatus Diapherotrites archaeon]
MIIKQSPQDFVVEEITLDGEVLEVGKEYSFSGGEGEHLVFVLEKTNWATMGAMKELGKRLHCSEKRLGFAGTKDRRAVTTQRCSAWNVKKEELDKVNIKDITLKPLCYGERVGLGDLWGNRFTITVREFDGEGKMPEKIPNFFGPQRFGGQRPITHLVGKAIVNGQFHDAADIYLFETMEGDPEREVREKCRGDYARALKEFPMHLKYERSMLGWLAKSPGDWVGALRALPRKLLVMFVHAYQSHLFNRVLEERGIEPRKGDVLEEGVPTGPLFGMECPLAAGEAGEIERRVLEGEWLGLRDFEIHGMPDLTSKGMRRRLWIEPKGFEVLEGGGSWIKVRFSLPKGCYATTALDYLK